MSIGRWGKIIAASALTSAGVFACIPCALGEKPQPGHAAVVTEGAEMDEAALESASRELMEAEAALLKEISKSARPQAPELSIKKSPAKPAPLAQAAPEKSAAPSTGSTRLSKEIAGEIETLHTNNTSLKKEVNSQTKSITSLSTDNAALKGRLSSSEHHVTTLLAKMKEMRNQLLMAETEISRLSSIIEDRNRTSLSRYSGEPKAMAPLKTAISPEKPSLLTQAQEEKASEDMPVATVIVENAQLRSGPGKNNSPLMAVSKGTRLAVEARLGEWYRVIAPTGARAWIDADIVAFAKDSQGSPTRTVKIQGYDAGVEQQAFEFIRGDMQ